MALAGRHQDLPKHLVEDNNQRTGKYARNLDEEAFLLHLNNILQSHEQAWPNEGQEPYPIIFFFGLPRCGKTFFSQIMTHSLDLAYPDNLVARFWKAPCHGIALSQILSRYLQSKSVFISDYGKTPGLNSPHDFAYFWHHWLGYDSVPYDYESVRPAIKWQELAKQLSKMGNTWGKASLFKGVLPSYHLAQIAEAYPRSIFIYITRDLIDCAVSLRKGRYDNYGDLNQWYGQTPKPEVYKELLRRPYNEQIAGQFKHLMDMYEENIELLEPERIMRIKYRSFCDHPLRTLESITQRIHKLFDFTIEIKEDVCPKSINFSTHSIDLPYYSELSESLVNAGLQIRQGK